MHNHNLSVHWTVQKQKRLGATENLYEHKWANFQKAPFNPLSSSYLGVGHESSRLSRKTQTFLYTAT